jgi:hypothetical protein
MLDIPSISSISRDSRLSRGLTPQDRVGADLNRVDLQVSFGKGDKVSLNQVSFNINWLVYLSARVPMAALICSMLSFLFSSFEAGPPLFMAS